MNLKYRLFVIAGLVLASFYALFPRNVVERIKRPTGIVYDTVRRVPLKRGLDLQGGMHLALEVDESKGPVADKGEAIQRALKVVRTRIDEFGVSEPLVQAAGNDRIIVELPGIDDPLRAQDVVQKSAFLQFQITDKTQALEKAFPRIDAAVRASAPKLAARGGTTPTPRADSGTGPTAVQGLFTTDTARAAAARKDTTARDSTKDSSKTDTAVAAGGDFSKLLSQGGLPGEYYVASSDIDKITSYLSMPTVQSALPPARVLRWGSDTITLGNKAYKPIYVLDARPIITGEYLTDAKPSTDPTEGTIVQFTLNNEGGRRFRSETSRHIKDFMAIVLDERVMGRPPVIQSAIGTRGQITMGGRDLQAASDLALVLRAGALPAHAPWPRWLRAVDRNRGGR